MRILLLAGEESGALYANRLRDGLLRKHPDVRIRGYADYGFETGDLAVMGFWAVLKRLFFFLRVKRTLERAIDDWRPDLVLTVDYPGMNLKLAAYAKARGIRAEHVVCPQVWAWKAGRIPKIEASVDRLFCFFPFEPMLFRPGFATFVGHPLAAAFKAPRADSVRAGEAPAQRDAGTAPEGTRATVAVLPGSRIGEIDRILPTLLAAVRELSSRHPEGLRFVIPAANGQAHGRIVALVSAAGLSEAVVIRSGGARDLLVREATCAVVASGTATLEAALAGCPTVLVYRVSACLAWFARRVIKGVRHVGLANVVAEKSGRACPMPELLQEDLTAENVVRELDRWLSDASARKAAQHELAATMSALATDGDPLSRIVDLL